MPRKASAGCACDESHAGATPKSTPVTSETKNAKPSTGSDGLASMGRFFASGKARAKIKREPP